MTVKGLPRLSVKLKKLEREYVKSVNNVLAEGALRIEGEMVESIQKGPKTGRRYKRGQVFHQASSPGQAPASDTGTLANRSISTRKTRKGRSYFIGVNKGGGLKYAKSLEFGTRKMAPRPFVRPAFKKWEPKIKKVLRQKLKTVAKRIT